MNISSFNQFKPGHTRKLEFETRIFEFPVESTFVFKLKSNRINNTQNILSIFEFQIFESSYAFAYYKVIKSN